MSYWCDGDENKEGKRGHDGERSDLRGSRELMERKVAMGTFHDGHPAQILESGSRVDRRVVCTVHDSPLR